MRVLHAVEAFGGGLFEVVRQIALEGEARDDDVAIVYGVRPETPPGLGGLGESGVELIELPAWTARSAASTVAGPMQLRRAVASWKPEVVHLHSSFAGVAGALAIAGRVPTAFSPQAFASSLATRGRSSAFALRRAERFVVRRVDLTIASSPSEAEYAIGMLGADSEKVVVVENGITELDQPPPPPLSQPTPVALAAGRLVSQRQPEASARILETVADVATIRWIGEAEGDRRESGLAALREAGVELTGWVPREEWLTELRQASVYLHWTASDGQPLSVLEAMAMDVPVVASDIPPSRDLLPPEQLCATEADASALIRRVVSDRSFADGLLAGQRERRERYGARRMARECFGLYDALVTRNGIGGSRPAQ